MALDVDPPAWKISGAVTHSHMFHGKKPWLIVNLDEMVIHRKY
jgi:hypothetical protein